MNLIDILKAGGGKSEFGYAEGNGNDRSLFGGKSGFVVEIKSGNLEFDDDVDDCCCCCSSSFLFSDGENFSFERCC